MTKQVINEIGLSKIQEQVGEGRSVQDEVQQSFTDWFQGHVMAAKATMQTQQPPSQEGAMEGEEGAA